MEAARAYLWEWTWALGLLLGTYASLGLIHFWTRRGNPCPALLKAQRVLLLTAHPDDECMFFGPTVVGLLGRGGSAKRLFLVCLSSGDQDGLGAQRKQELRDSCRVLGIKDEDLYIYQSTRLKDGLKTEWPVEEVASIAERHMLQLGVDLVVTFDRYGVSGHPNHQSLFYGLAALHLKSKIPQGVEVLCVESVSRLRKYLGPCDSLLSWVVGNHQIVLTAKERKRVLEAMACHQSQIVWFRRLYLLFSRYTFLNSFSPIRSEALELSLALD
ncbi:N-acetylglucosaminyl-phosphatidylinositol de-N-acetylase [Neocloeon triangulifer]|uniref:N-acetylglucosaminyl-phosphatidylinositol de-N-acetylase n=1 Tax=Neocloeon triangulifer TaxID=2078957 RepID=UPI00286EFB0E|nr:N-acetylglucosaminyl-phosphatidylinositol de-N-acetylase [Neocloeon triangulifer]